MYFVYIIYNITHIFNYSHHKWIPISQSTPQDQNHMVSQANTQWKLTKHEGNFYKYSLLTLGLENPYFS